MIVLLIYLYYNDEFHFMVILNSCHLHIDLLWNAYPHHQSETSAAFGQEHLAILARFCDPSEGTWQRRMWWSSRVSVTKWAEIRLVSDGIFVDRLLWGFIRHITWTTHVFLQWQNNYFLHAIKNMCRNNGQVANDLVPAFLLLFGRKVLELLTPHSDLTICLPNRKPCLACSSHTTKARASRACFNGRPVDCNKSECMINWFSWPFCHPI